MDINKIEENTKKNVCAVTLAMLRLKECKEQITNENVVKESGLQHSVVSRALKELEILQRKIIITKDLSDGRKNVIEFTPYGEATTKMLCIMNDITPDSKDMIEFVNRIYDKKERIK